jgi:DNA-binding NarL/FixJ family response regulator
VESCGPEVASQDLCVSPNSPLFWASATHIDTLSGPSVAATRKREPERQTRGIFRLTEEGLEKKDIATELRITEDRVSHRLEGL